MNADSEQGQALGSPAAPRTRAVILGVISVLVILLIIVKGRAMLADQQEPPKRKAPPPQARVVQVIEVTPVQHTVRVSGHAAAAPARELSLVSEVSGRILQAHENLRPGGFVRKGATLIELDPTDINIAIKRLEAEIAGARARVAALRVQRTGARATVTHAKEALDLAEKQVGRESGLVKEGHLAGAALDRTRIEVTGQKDRLLSARTTAKALPHQLAEARAQIAAAEQQLAQQHKMLERATLTAAFDLQVRSGGVEVGEWVSAGQPMATVEDVSAVELAFAVPLDDLLWLTRPTDDPPASRAQWAALLKGRSATVARDDAHEGHTWTGHIERVGPGLTEATRMVQVYVRVTDTLSSPAGKPPLPLLPGMFCRVSIEGRTLDNVVVLPRKVVQPDGDVFVVGPDQTLQRRPVKVLLREREHVVIGAGLQAGDQVITTALPGASEGMRLQVGGDEKPGEVAER